MGFETLLGQSQNQSKDKDSLRPEGVHHEHGDRRTILGSNGVLVVLSRDGKIITAFPPDTDSTKYYDKWTAHTYFDKVEHRLSLLTRIQKWLGL